MKQNITKVQFLKPVNGQTEYFFGSIAAIYEKFSTEEIGCTLQTLWGRVSEETPYITKKCIISKHPVVRKPQINKK